MILLEKKGTGYFFRTFPHPTFQLSQMRSVIFTVFKILNSILSLTLKKSARIF